MRKAIVGVSVGLVVLLVVPVVLASFETSERRSFERVSLEDIRFRDVSFRNTAQDLRLTGMLFVPEGAGPFPAAVVIHGSGSSHRDNGWYLTLVQYLRANGIAVLLPDKRGSEGSEGDWRSASFEDLATDAAAAVAFLENQSEIPISRVGVIGMSQGGHIAPVVADRSEDVAFVVNVVGGALPMHDMLVYEEKHNLRELGVLPGLSDILAYPAAGSIIMLRQREFWSAVGDFDPRPYWKRLSVPALVLYGENDTNVPSRKSAEALRALENPRIEVTVYGGSGHALESPVGEGNSIFRRDALRDIRDFVHVRAGASGASLGLGHEPAHRALGLFPVFS